MIKLENISFHVEDKGRKKSILKDINLEIDNRFVAITGPNGSGKSTLAKIIVGLEKPTSGKIFFDGEDVTNLDATERARMGMSFAFQQPVKFKGLTVKDMLDLSADKNLSKSEACDYLSEVGLCAEDYINRELNSSLSGGELKRIEIAMIIARGTKVTVLDEPEAGIDLWSFQNLIKVFEKMYSENKGMIIIISHQERILDISDDIIVMDQGRVGEFGKKEDILPKLLVDSTECKFFREVN